MVGPATTAYAVEGDEGRVIHVVYDDSGSMKSNNRWSQALYAMEVFAAMLGGEDEMVVYPMNAGRAIEVEGDDPDRIETLVRAMGGGGGTPFSAVSRAMKDLLEEDAEQERWLVVLTDGEFTGTVPSIGAEAQLKEYAAQGVKVMYLAIDSSSTAGIVFQSDESVGFYAYDAVNSTEVLGCITEMANQIFQQQKMPASHITVTGNTVSFHSDIPLSQVLIFAQGDGITVSDMTLGSEGLKATESHQVEVTNANAPGGGYVADGGLRGAVQTYNAGSSPYAPGTYSFTCSDTSNLEIYYIAGVEIDCCLTYNGVEVKAGERHYAGEYGVSMRFINPLTGEEVKGSDLLDGAVLTAEIKNGDNTIAVDATTSTIRLKQGETKLTARATLPGNVTVTSQKTYTVYPEPILLDVRAQVPGGDYSIVGLGEQAQPITVTVYSNETGQIITREEWDAIGDDLKVSASGVDFVVRRGDDVGTWNLWPDYVTDMTDTATGEIEVTVKAEYEIGTQAASGATQFKLFIQGDTVVELKVDIAAPEDPIHLNDLGDETGAVVTLAIKDIYTGQFKPLTDDQAKAVEFAIEADALNWKLVRGEAQSTWYLLPVDDASLLTFGELSMDPEAEEVAVVVTATLQEEMITYQGSDSALLKLIPLSIVEKIGRIIGYIVFSAVALFILLGYLCKKKLRFKQMKPYVQNPDTLERLNVAKKRVWWSYLLPWFAQRATITCFVPSYHCTFSNAKIIAAGGGSFRIMNIQSYASDRIRLNGKRVDPARDRKKNFSHVTLNMLNEGEDVIGKAHF